MDISLDGAVGKKVGSFPHPTVIRNLQSDQLKVMRLLAAIPAAQGGKKETWGDWNPLVGVDGDCSPTLAQAILDFQTHWKGQRDIFVADGVVDSGKNTIGLMNELADLASGGFILAPPEGQLDTTACWAACLSWMTQSNPKVATKAQIGLLALGTGVTNADGTITKNGLMTVNLSGVFLNRQLIDADKLEAMIRAHQFPLFVGFSGSPQGGHVNVLHGFDERKSEIFAMEPWYPDPSTNPNYTREIVSGMAIYSKAGTGEPFKFQGTHIRRSLSYYLSRPLEGKFIAGTFAS
jgi:hypothetical protein